MFPQGCHYSGVRFPHTKNLMLQTIWTRHTSTLVLLGNAGVKIQKKVMFFLDFWTMPSRQDSSRLSSATGGLFNNFEKKKSMKRFHTREKWGLCWKNITKNRRKVSHTLGSVVRKIHKNQRKSLTHTEGKKGLKKPQNRGKDFFRPRFFIWDAFPSKFLWALRAFSGYLWCSVGKFYLNFGGNREISNTYFRSLLVFTSRITVFSMSSSRSIRFVPDTEILSSHNCIDFCFLNEREL